jgi:hypothetical protein
MKITKKQREFHLFASGAEKQTMNHNSPAIDNIMFASPDGFSFSPRAELFTSRVCLSFGNLQFNGADEPQPRRGVGFDPLWWLARFSRETSGPRRIRPNGRREARAIHLLSIFCRLYRNTLSKSSTMKKQIDITHEYYYICAVR